MLDKNVLFEHLGVNSISEIARMYNISHFTVRNILDKVNDISEFDEEVVNKVNSITKRRRLINPLGDSKFNKLRYHYSTIEELQFHANNCDDENKIYIFNKFIDLDKFGDILPTRCKSFKEVFYESVLKPGSAIPDCVLNSLDEECFTCITKDELVTDILVTIGENKFINNIFVPAGYIYTDRLGILSYKEAGAILNLNERSVENYKYSYTQDEINTKISEALNGIDKILYHNELLSISELSSRTGFSIPYLNNNLTKDKFKVNADWLDNMVQIRPYLVTEKNKCIVYFEGKETNVYELAERFNKDVKVIKSYYFEYKLAQEEIEFILNNNIDLRMYKYGFNVNGEWLLMPEVAKRFNVTVGMIKVLLRKGLTREEVLLKLSNERNVLLEKSNKSKGVTVTVGEVKFSSYIELDRFINVTENTSRAYIVRYGEENFIKSYHFNERLLFKDNSPYSTWFTDDTWIYECHVCRRKLLMSTEELINYKHDDKLCKEYEIEGDVII